MSKILEALKGLNPKNDEHWTAEGSPRLDALGIEGVKRSDVIAVAPHFRRDALVLATPNQVKIADEAEAKAAIAKEEMDDIVNRLDAQVKKTGDVLNKLQIESHDLAKRMNKALAEHDNSVRAFEVYVGKRNPQHDIMDYIAATQRSRAEKAEKAK